MKSMTIEDYEESYNKLTKDLMDKRISAATDYIKASEREDEQEKTKLRDKLECYRTLLDDDKCRGDKDNKTRYIELVGEVFNSLSAAETFDKQFRAIGNYEQAIHFEYMTNAYKAVINDNSLIEEF